ncbi:unnamed protein product [Caenorhabditis bovis]|uniref:Chitin-binding type-2 domain-containing protein n=1 Tax=Caenorhabditis bovis TaxID=2654633 RepID=A0A8S1EVP9_9PELO|nr:unnamed protein product [Caenorhabditis bovis]
MMLRRVALLCLIFFVGSNVAQTPVIGGTCKLGTADVQIGGKQTQFFLKCETTADSADGEGVWVVKSRAATPTAAAPAQASIPAENTQPQQHPKARKPTSPNICEQDNGARESESCAVSATCLQAHNEFPSSYLQCDQTTLRWVRKSCQDGFLFNFEQQTCIVPKRMSSLSRKSDADPPSTLTNDPCSKCQLGTACRNGECVPLTTSNVCSDGSPPNGTCFDTPCPSNHFCTSKSVCCPVSALQSSLGCPLACTINESCPSGMECHNNCCEVRKILRHPNSEAIKLKDAEDLKYIFEASDELFNGVEESKPLEVELPKSVKIPMPPGSAPPPPPSSASTDAPKCAATEPSAPCGGTNANCSSDADCPTSFLCEHSCCRLAICPRTDAPVRFTCRTQYHCRANEVCIFGGCCPRSKSEDLAVLASSGYGNQSDCDVDNRVESCDIDNACPESSECLAGICCKLPPVAKCANGLMALSIPAVCDLSDDCPIASRCEYGKCCPLASEKTAAGGVDEPEPTSIGIEPIVTLSSAKVWKKTEQTGISLEKNKCLSSQKCDIRTLCPPEFTCSTSGKCCRLGVRCPDGTVPETSCNSTSTSEYCPSSSHKCTLLEGKYHACCYFPEGDLPGIPSCPMGSVEVEPRFGKSCRYSLQCPSPYFCQPASGLVCTFSSCSNSNPCSVGTCNNGYCCSSSSNSAPSIIDNATSTTATTITSTIAPNPKSITKSKTLNINNNNNNNRNKKQHKKPTKKEFDTLLTEAVADFPVGPPGYGFPEHLANLDEVLVKASGDGTTCAGGFTSKLVCSIANECPAGLHCDLSSGLCCPMILPLVDPKNPKKSSRRRKPKEKQQPMSSYPCGCLAGSGSNCVGCNQNTPQIITIPQNSCPGGGYSVGSCSSGFCATGYTCVQNQCCPSYSAPPRISVYTCPSGNSAVGACISGRCASGYQCVNNACCPQTTTTNPFVCPDGTQAAGGCVNGQCGSGYTCSNGLCCAGTTNTVRCLDGSEAVGACIPSCTGNACGGTQVSYYCGSGYTCTTGNICCAINSCPNGGEPLGPAINGLCPTGYTVQGNLCCSSSCPDGSAGTPPVNNVCPAGTTLTNGVCCGGAGAVTCADEIAIGPCDGTGNNGGCQAGYACDTTNGNCCPVVDYNNEACQVGPAIDGLCPPGYVVVYIPNSPLINNGVNPGTCIDLQCTQGLCAADQQIGECDDTGACPAGYTCNFQANICCSAAFSRRRIAGGKAAGAQKPVYGRPLHSYMPPRAGGFQTSSCADGSLSSGPCMNGLCGLGLECHNGQCCAPGQQQKQLQSKCPSGDTAVSGCFANGSCGTGFECVASLNLCCPPGQPSAPIAGPFGGVGSPSPRPIGARCMIDNECVGNGEGLSMCHAGVCQCSPIAYSQGIACIRRKSFQMNDDPVIDAIEDKTSQNSVSV